MGLKEYLDIIGGYQPAQKWLKDRKERALSFEDIRHYQKVIVALTETEKIMGEIDEVGGNVMRTIDVFSASLYLPYGSRQ